MALCWGNPSKVFQASLQEKEALEFYIYSTISSLTYSLIPSPCNSLTHSPTNYFITHTLSLIHSFTHSLTTSPSPPYWSPKVAWCSRPPPCTACRVRRTAASGRQAATRTERSSRQKLGSLHWWGARSPRSPASLPTPRCPYCWKYLMMKSGVSEWGVGELRRGRAQKWALYEL